MKEFLLKNESHAEHQPEVKSEAELNLMNHQIILQKVTTLTKSLMTSFATFVFAHHDVERAVHFYAHDHSDCDYAASAAIGTLLLNGVA
jgi:hypothetical protein